MNSGLLPGSKLWRLEIREENNRLAVLRSIPTAVTRQPELHCPPAAAHVALTLRPSRQSLPVTNSVLYQADNWQECTKTMIKVDGTIPPPAKSCALVLFVKMKEW